MDTSRLKRSVYEMPEDVRQHLTDQGLMDAYRSRPPYQQNDYIGWILMAKQPATREKRIRQMLDELKAGDTYMKMAYHRK